MTPPNAAALAAWYDLAKVIGAWVAAAGGISATIIAWLTHNKTTKIELSLNGRLNALLDAEHARGRLAERQDIIEGRAPNPAQMTLDIPTVEGIKE